MIDVCCSNILDMWPFLGCSWPIGDYNLNENWPFISCKLIIVNISSTKGRTPCLNPPPKLGFGLYMACTGFVHDAIPTDVHTGSFPAESKRHCLLANTYRLWLWYSFFPIYHNDLWISEQGVKDICSIDSWKFWSLLFSTSRTDVRFCVDHHLLKTSFLRDIEIWLNLCV